MIYFDEKQPNKYNFLKKRIYPHKLYNNYTKKRYGGLEDGSYVFLQELFEKSKYIYSYGVGSDFSGLCFDRHVADLDKLVYMYDGSITELPAQHENFIFKSEHIFAGKIQNHIKENGHENEQNMILKMDIEGYEYEVINSDVEFIKNHFNQLSIEIHSLIEETPEGWVAEEPMLAMKTNENAKKDFFDNLSKYYNIVHIHGNNHSPRYVDFPDSLEITFLRKDHLVVGVDESRFPVDGLDFPNYNGREDYVLDWWV